MNSVAAYLAGGEKLKVLDGLRGAAVTVVVLFHSAIHGPEEVGECSPELIWAGWCGVDLFFVLSGFLITGILLGTREDKHYLRTFYARRVLRIFPLYYLFLIAFYLIHRSVGSFWPQVLHFSNLHVVSLEDWGRRSPASLTWSLSIEEQFYLVWPVVVYALKRRTLLIFCVALAVLSLLLRLSYGLRGAPIIVSYASTACRVDALAIGAALSIALRHPRVLHLLAKWAPVGLGASLAGVGFVAFESGTLRFWEIDAISFSFLLSAIALAFAFILTLAVCYHESRAVRLLANPALCAVGRHSYAMYLAHVEVILFLRRSCTSGVLVPIHKLSPAVQALLFHMMALICTFVLSVVIWHLVEKWFLRLKSRFTYHWDANDRSPEFPSLGSPSGHKGGAPAAELER